MSLWPTFVSGVIAERSRPLFIDADRNLVVSVADASCGQELSMTKGKIFSSLSKAANSLGIEIRGLRLDLKHYHSASTMPAVEQREPPLRPSQQDLDSLSLSPAEQEELAQLSLQM